MQSITWTAALSLGRMPLLIRAGGKKNKSRLLSRVRQASATLRNAYPLHSRPPRCLLLHLVADEFERGVRIVLGRVTHGRIAFLDELPADTGASQHT